MAEKYTAAELEMLSPEERAGVEDDSPDAAELDHQRQQKEARGESTDDPSDGYTGGEDDNTTTADAKADDKAAPKADATAEPKADAKADAAVADAGDGKDAKAEKTEVVDDGPPDRVPQIPVEVRDWVKEKAELRKQYDDGDLSQDDYDEKRDALTLAQSEARVAAKINQAQAEATWTAHQDAFFGAHEQYVLKAGMRAALDLHVNRIDRETQSKLSGLALLNRAHAAVCEEFGLPVGKAAVTDESDAERTTTKVIDKVRKVPSEAKAVKEAIDASPKTLGEVPSAGDEDIGLDKFAHIDAMMDKNPMEAERMIAKLSDAERAEFLGEGGDRVR